MLLLPALILLFDLFHGSQLFFPISLQAPGDQPVFRLNAVVLTLGSFGFIAGSFQPEVPLMAQGGIFLLQGFQAGQG